MNDLTNTVAFRRMISPFRQTNSSSAVVSQIIDLQAAKACGIVIQTGALTDANATFAALLEESDASDMSGAATVAAASMSSGIAPATRFAFAFGDDDTFKYDSYVGTKRYIRLTITPTGNDSGNLDVAAFAILELGKQP